MKPRLKGSLVILAIVLALALPGAYGITINGIDNGGSYNAAVSAATGGVVSLNSIGSFPMSFTGDSAKKVSFSKKWTTGLSTFSEVGFLLRNTDSYDVTVNGGRDNTLKTTNARLDLKASADDIKAWGDSGTANLYKSGVDLRVDHGTADVIITTSADGILKTTTADLATNDAAGHNDAITGGIIDTDAYFKGASTKNSQGYVDTHIVDGSLGNLDTFAISNVGVGYAKQAFDSAEGDRLVFTADTVKAVGGKNKEAKTRTEITDGYINGYKNYVNDNHDTPTTRMALQSFNEAGATNGISIENIYTESSKGLKIQAEQDADVGGAGTLATYVSTIDDPKVIQTVDDAYAGNPKDGANVVFNGIYKKITGSKTAQMNSETSVTNGDLQNFRGEASDDVYLIAGVHSFGTRQGFGTARGSNIYLDNKYTDNKNGYKETTVTSTDASPLDGALTNFVGTASSNGATPDTREQVETAGLETTLDAYKYYNQHAQAVAHAADPWTNFGIAYVDGPEAYVGHLIGTTESIQHTIDTAPSINGIDQDIFLRDTSNINLFPAGGYVGDGNRDIVSNIVAGNNIGEKSFTMWGAGSYLKYYTGFAPNTVIDAQADSINHHRLFDLTSGDAAQTFDFKNINFNNGYSYWSAGGAIRMLQSSPYTNTATIENSNFNYNTAKGAAGGAILNMGGTLNLLNTNFDHNSADIYGSGGGAICNDEGTVHIKSGSFTLNSAISNGGAILNEGGTVTSENAAFTGNSAGTGGAVFNQYTGSAAIYESTGDTFTSNSAGSGFRQYGGGAIYLQSGTTVTATGDSFIGNYAGILPIPAGHGGAVLKDNSHGQAGGTALYSDPRTTYFGNMPNDVETN